MLILFTFTALVVALGPEKKGLPFGSAKTVAAEVRE
jgi:hypothetical protein